MKLICISDKAYPHLNNSDELFNKILRYLTIGNEYESLNYHNWYDEYLIIDDDGSTGYYPSDNFITQSQIREEKLNKILNENI